MTDLPETLALPSLIALHDGIDELFAKTSELRGRDAGFLFGVQPDVANVLCRIYALISDRRQDPVLKSLLLLSGLYLLLVQPLPDFDANLSTLYRPADNVGKIALVI